MKAISRKFKKHVINNPDQLGAKYDAYDDVMQPRASFRPLQNPNSLNVDSLPQNSTQTPPAVRKKTLQEKLVSAVSPPQER